MSANFCIVGPQPPPRHGVSAVNEAMASFALSKGFSTVLLNTAPDSLDRSISVRIGRVARIVSAFSKLGRHVQHKTGPVYLSLSGGFGLFWEALLAWRARVTGAAIIVHHHSFRYLDQPYLPMRLLVWAAGSGALHVVLGGVMGRSLQQRYAGVGDMIVLSNACFVGPPLAEGSFRKSDTPQTVGLLANLSRAKGLDDFLELAETSQARGLSWKYILAGPFEDARDQKRVAARIAALSNLEYRGPLYAEAKGAFLGEIDVFVFPTRYRHEAEPLVLLEAMRHGCPVISYARGCISEMVGEEGGRTISVGSEFVEPSLAILEAWRREDVEFQQLSNAARKRFADLHAQSIKGIRLLFERFGGITS